jgi:hypothetical protein
MHSADFWFCDASKPRGIAARKMSKMAASLISDPSGMIEGSCSTRCFARKFPMSYAATGSVFETVRARGMVPLPTIEGCAHVHPDRGASLF